MELYQKNTTSPDSTNHLSRGYFYQHPTEGFSLCVGTVAQPDAGVYSLGANRIVPADLESTPGFDLQTMAMDLASRMQEKIEMMRRFKLSHASGLGEMEQFFGGKCVGLPRNGSRVGEADYSRYLEFQIDCFKDYENRTGNKIITGQDLGHGPVDATTDSLKFMESRFHGIVSTDTSFVTGLGVFHLAKGMLTAAQKPLGPQSRIAVIGAGKIGLNMVRMFHDYQAEVVVLESDPVRIKLAEEAGVSQVYRPEAAQEFFAEPVDAVIANANCGSFHSQAIDWILENKRVRILTGAENLAMPYPSDEKRLRDSGRQYAPTEISGLMGALAAASEYSARLDGKSFDHGSMIPVAEQLEAVGEKSTEWMLRQSELDFYNASKKAFPNDQPPYRQY